MEQLRVKTEQDKKNVEVFKPVINNRSKKILQVKQMQSDGVSPGKEPFNTDIVDRLYTDASSRIEKNMRTH